MDTLQALVDKIITEVLNPIITLLFILATVVFMWGVISYIIGGKGDPKKLEDAKRIILYGLIGMFVMVSAWGFVKILCNFFETCA